MQPAIVPDTGKAKVVAIYEDLKSSHRLFLLPVRCLIALRLGDLEAKADDQISHSTW